MGKEFVLRKDYTEDERKINARKTDSAGNQHFCLKYIAHVLAWESVAHVRLMVHKTPYAPHLASTCLSSGFALQTIVLSRFYLSSVFTFRTHSRPPGNLNN